ncbi:NLR family CARD domain-containing protein 4-like [Amphiura filiformis]|uniref:NLR family CARD domain-containing protein 4-like n=1 Tax=Amphiura filiformis TaxID=82378 RepID=UPI003B20C7AC
MASGGVVDDDVYYKCFKGLHLVTQEAISCVDNCLKVWHCNQAISACTTGNCPKGKKPKQPASCQNCIDWGNAVEATVYHPPSSKTQVTWTNVSSSSFSKSHVEIAKAFVLRLPNKKPYTSIADFDTASLLMIMSRFQEFHGGDYTSYENISKVADMRNEMSHMGLGKNMHIDDRKAEEYFKNLDALAISLEKLHPGYYPTALDIQSQLKTIQAAPMTLTMKNELEVLIKQEMQPIVDAIKVMSTKVDQIDDEMKKTTGSTKRMEDKITEIKEKMTELELGPQKQTSDPDKFDLAACQKELREYYLDKMGTVQLLPWVPGDNKEMESIFVDLELVRNESSQALERNEDLVTLKTGQGQRANRVLLMGEAGSGKSTTAANLAYKWALNDKESPLFKFTLVFMIHMHEIHDSNASLVKLIFDQILAEDSQVSREGLKSYIASNPTKVLILFDGLDESHSGAHKNRSSEVSKVLQSRMFRECCVILTSRPHKISDLGDHISGYTQVKLNGFSWVNILKYIHKFFKEDAEKGRKLIRKLEYERHILALASMPVLLLMICLLWDDESRLPNTQTEMYQKTITYLWKRYQTKNRVETSSEDESDNEELGDELNHLLNKIGEVALQGWSPDHIQVVFREKDFGREICMLGCQVGIISKLRKRRSLKMTSSVTFLHSTFQDFCIAVHLAHLFHEGIGKKKFTELLEKFVFFTPDSVNFAEFVLGFCCGIEPKVTKIFIEYNLEVLAKHSFDTKEMFLHTNITLYLRQIFESQLSSQQCMDLIPLFPDTCNLSLTIMHHKLIPSLLYLLKVFESVPMDKGLFSYLKVLEITIGYLPLIPILLTQTINLEHCEMIISKGPKTTNTDLDLMYTALSKLVNLKRLHLKNRYGNVKYDITNLLCLFAQTSVRLTHVRLEGFLYDVKIMNKFLSKLSGSLIAITLSGTLNTQLQPASASEVIRGLSVLKKLSMLELGAYKIGNVVKKLKPIASQLEQLALVQCELHEGQLKELFSILNRARRLKRLNLSRNGFTVNSMIHLVECLRQLPVIQELSLTNTGLTDETASILAECLKEKSSLRSTNLGSNPGIGPNGRAALKGLSLLCPEPSIYDRITIQLSNI